MSRKWRWAAGVLGIAACCAAAGLVTRALWLPAIGRALVLPGSDANNLRVNAAVLGIPGSPWLSSALGSDRLAFAADWIRQGRAKFVVMTCGTSYGISGCESGQRTLLAEGRGRVPLREVYLPSSPSEVEAAALLAEIARSGEKSAVILANPLESRRLDRIYRSEGAKRGIAVTVVSVPDPNFDPADWWRVREGRKALVYELSQWVGFP